MSKIINPRTGRPAGPTNEELQQYVYMLSHKVDALNAQLIQLGIFTEWLADQLDNIGDVDPESFEPFAKARLAQIQQEAQAMQRSYLDKATQQAQASTSEDTSRLNLNE